MTDQVSGPMIAQARESVGIRYLSDGVEYYRHMIWEHTSIKMHPEEIHELGLSEVDELAGAMMEVVSEAGFGEDLNGYRQFLRTDIQFYAQSKEPLQEQMEILSKRIDRLLPTFFGHFPRITYGIELIPEEISGQMPPAYAQPNPANRSISGIHWKGWSREQAVDYMNANMAISQETVESEIDRYIAWPAQALTYQLGKIKFCELRVEAESTLGDQFSLSEFHDILMSLGPLSLPLLEKSVKSWLLKANAN